MELLSFSLLCTVWFPGADTRPTLLGSFLPSPMGTVWGLTLASAPVLQPPAALWDAVNSTSGPGLAGFPCCNIELFSLGPEKLPQTEAPTCTSSFMGSSCRGLLPSACFEPCLPTLAEGSSLAVALVVWKQSSTSHCRDVIEL